MTDLTERVAYAIMAEQMPPHPMRLLPPAQRNPWMRSALAARRIVGDAVGDIAGEIRSFAMNMRRDAADARDGGLVYYAEAIEGFADELIALAAATGTAKTAKRAECEASQSGAESATPNPSNTSSSQSDGRGL